MFIHTFFMAQQKIVMCWLVGYSRFAHIYTHKSALKSAYMENSLNWVINNDGKSSQIEYEMAKISIYVQQKHQFFCQNFFVVVRSYIIFVAAAAA